MRFQKGRSANSGGRPKALQTIEQLAREQAPLAIQTLAAIMHDATVPAGARVTAASAILDRAYGKPRQSIEHDSGESLGDLLDAARCRVLAEQKKA